MSGQVDVLFLRLEGPLQSWGVRSRWSVRDTRTEPTKSGVIGMIAAASGWGLDQEGDEQVAALVQQVSMGVRVERPGQVIRDYHTVLGPLLTAQGKVKRTQSTGEFENIVSERYYLSDACFLVALAGPVEKLERARDALRDPTWPPFLGRRSCPPSAPITPAHPAQDTIQHFTSLEEAVTGFEPWLGADRGEQPPEKLRCVIELPDPRQARRDRPLQRRQDVPLSFAHRRFRYRYVYETYIQVPGEVS